MFKVIRHLKNQNLYAQEVAPAKFQVSRDIASEEINAYHNQNRKGRIVYDGDEVTIYRNEEGMTFVRFPDEMTDGRFETIA